MPEPEPNTISHLMNYSDLRTPNSDGHYLYHYYQSAGSLNQHLETPLPFGGSMASSLKNDNEWNGGFSYDAAKDALTSGWSEGAQNIRELSEPLFDSISSLIERQEIDYDVTGNYLDVARFVEGEPECWGTFHDIITEGSGQRVLRLTYNIVASCGISAEVMAMRGAVITSLVNALQFAGYRVEVVLQCGIGDSEPISSSLVEILLKAADQPLDLDKLAFQTCPAMFRRMLFRWMELQTEAYRVRYGVGDHSAGYGQVRPVNKRFHGDIHLDGAHLNDEQWSTPEKARTWILTQLQKQGVKILEHV